MIKIFSKIANYLKREKLELVKESLNGKPYDFGYFYSLQLKKLEEMYKYFETSKYLCEDKQKEILRYISLSIKMLKIGYFNGGDLFDIINMTDEKDENGFRKIECSRYVNMKNMHRFESVRNIIYDDYELYEAKARSLYHKICNEKSQLWWD